MACFDFPCILLMFLQHNWNSHVIFIGISSDLTISHLTVMCFLLMVQKPGKAELAARSRPGPGQVAEWPKMAGTLRAAVSQVAASSPRGRGQVLARSPQFHFALFLLVFIDISFWAFIIHLFLCTFVKNH